MLLLAFETMECRFLQDARQGLIQIYFFGLRYDVVL